MPSDPAASPAPATATAVPKDFIREIVEEDLRTGKHDGVVTRFPPEPNGYLHIGHAKAICLSFGIAQEYGGRCHLRFDDTNPVKEDTEYVDSIQEDVRWLGFDWGEHLYYASDYFGQLHDWAVGMIQTGLAYVCDLSAEEMRAYRGTLTEPGRPSPWRDRTVEDNLDLFARMRAGEFPEGARVLRARIDMAHPNVSLRDPVLYRILHQHHHRTGDAWCIYPTYDYAHGQSDALEHITHSLCTLEFEIHRPLYEWFIDHLPVPARPRQIEFSRLNLTNTVMSKRKLLLLVKDGHVDGWDDPRMPTISGFRRRGYTPESIRQFCTQVGITKYKGVTDIGVLEHCIRNDLNASAPRAMAVLDPLKVVIENYPEDQVEEMELANHPSRPEMGTRQVPFCRELYVEREDFMENPPKDFFRLSPGREVRLRGAYFLKCESIVKDADGQVTELRCTYDPETRGGNNPPDGRKVKATLHWVSARHSKEAEVRLYDRLFTAESPDAADGDFLDLLNPGSLQILKGCRVEASLIGAQVGDRFQFERLGYFVVDSKYSQPGHPVFNRTVGLKDAWAKAKGA